MNSNERFIRALQISEAMPDSKYYAKIPAIRQIVRDGMEFKRNVAFLVGENGSGKSTIIEAIAAASGFNPEGGTRNYCFATRNSYSDLYQYMRIIKGRYPKTGYFLRAESFYNVASKEEEYAEEDPNGVKKEFHLKSHGEAFLSLIEDFLPNGLYILDEPEAALSVTMLMKLMCRIHELEKKNCQFVIATHSPILMSYPGALIYELNGQGYQEVDYRDTEHYRIMKAFMDQPERMHQLLFNDREDL